MNLMELTGFLLLITAVPSSFILGVLYQKTRKTKRDKFLEEFQNIIESMSNDVRTLQPKDLFKKP